MNTRTFSALGSAAIVLAWTALAGAQTVVVQPAQPQPSTQVVTTAPPGVAATSGHTGDGNLAVSVLGPWLDMGARGGCPVGGDCRSMTVAPSQVGPGAYGLAAVGNL